ncbi:glycosyltransferase 87 family protein [Subtercola endophyticus]|uniref:glycosyltransferase 87 family protein n=1 Tax=Subtercola endophyticus TaxID=2895559 RepID=UPI001E5A8A92|nr:glycosyltransferase 87 family protein [Subtercola endophyticus]UFS59715.1 glycosyltransferase 87 family protein [Subtercola endophyticus]
MPDTRDPSADAQPAGEPHSSPHAAPRTATPRLPHARAFTALTALVLAVMAALTVLSVSTLGFFDPSDAGGIVWYTIALWLLFVAVALLLRRVPRRAAIVLIIAGSAVLSGAALAGPPNTSTDSARYALDGMVQNEGVSPYTYVPADDALAQFRTTWLFVPAVNDSAGHPQCPTSPRIERSVSLPSFQVICTVINRPQVHTIYPPGAELYFAGVRFWVPTTAEYWPFQLTGALISVGISIVLVLALLRRRMDARWAALWAFSPFVATEAVTNSHVDALAALLLLLATLFVARGSAPGAVRDPGALTPAASTSRAATARTARTIVGGVVLGLSIAVKLVPVIGAPALLRRHPLKVAIPAMLTFAVLYVPYVLATGIAVIGFLPGYLAEEGYDDGSRFALLSIVAPGPVAIVLAGILLLVTAVLVWRRTDPENPWLGQVVMIGTTMLVVTPHYSWYALLLVPFVVLSRRWEWMAVPAALTAQLLVPTLAVARVSFALAIVVVLAGLGYRTYYRRVYRT